MSPGDHVGHLFSLFSDPLFLSHSVWKEERDWIIALGLPPCLPLAVTSSYDNSSFSTISLSASSFSSHQIRHLHYFLFSFRRGGAYGCSVGTLTLLLTPLNLFHLCKQVSLRFSFKIPAGYALCIQRTLWYTIEHSQVLLTVCDT